MITCQIERLRTPRARATEPGRGPNLRREYTRVPCLPRSRKREEEPAARREKLADMQEKVHFIHIHIGVELASVGKDAVAHANHCVS